MTIARGVSGTHSTTGITSVLQIGITLGGFSTTGSLLYFFLYTNTNPNGFSAMTSGFSQVGSTVGNAGGQGFLSQFISPNAASTNNMSVTTNSLCSLQLAFCVEYLGILRDSAAHITINNVTNPQFAADPSTGSLTAAGAPILVVGCGSDNILASVGTGIMGSPTGGFTLVQQIQNTTSSGPGLTKWNLGWLELIVSTSTSPYSCTLSAGGSNLNGSIGALNAYKPQPAAGGAILLPMM